MNPASPTPDDLDQVFSRYFKAQLPSRWPVAPIPVHAAPAVPAARTGSWRTRLTLGASVAALLAVGFGLSYGPGTVPAQPKGGVVDTNAATANGDKIEKHMPKDDVKPMDGK